ncbi:hypothetical protein Daesc_003578 [Daldinia eschscholtzii]|uniref:Uncharacterized protein n=1 Tax=Daldinia eschscholtzii TaxID=292717 RepID=A0AAX6MUS5_9PEZI
MDPRAFPPEIREKIQWAGNGVLTYHDATSEMKNPPRIRERYEEYPELYGSSWLGGSWHGHSNPSSIPSNPTLPFYSPPPYFTCPPEPRRAYVESAADEGEPEEEHEDEDDDNDDDGANSEPGLEGTNTLYEDEDEDEDQDSESLTTAPSVRDNKNRRWSWGSNNPYLRAKGVAPLPLTTANVNAVPDASRRGSASRPQFSSTLLAIPGSPPPQRRQQQRNAEATTSSRPRSQGHRRSTAVDLRSIFNLSSRFRMRKRNA